MDEKRFIELQLGAARAQVALHLDDAKNKKLNDILRTNSTALLAHAAASRDYWQSLLGELGEG